MHKDRDQSGDNPQWRAPGFPERAIPPPLTPTRCPLDKYQDAEEGPSAPLSVRRWSGHCISRRASCVTLYRSLWLFGRPSSSRSTQRVFPPPSTAHRVQCRNGRGRCFQLRSPVGTLHRICPRSSTAHSRPVRPSPQEGKLQETERDLPRTAKLPLQRRRHLQIP